MTNSNWKPVAHADYCPTRVWHSCISCIDSCSGTRWHGYGERVGDFAGVWALTWWLAGLKQGQEPVAEVVPSRVYLDAVNIEFRVPALPAGTKLYAAPVQTAAAQPVAVPDEVMRALYRMCTPLDDSWLGSKSATAQEDARCMNIIREYIMSVGRSLATIHDSHQPAAPDAAVKESLTTGAQARIPFSLPDAAIERIYDNARRMFRHHIGSARGQQVTQADSHEYHIINATLDELRATVDNYQPSAPADDVVRDAAVGAAIERAARDLPRHYWIEIEIENGAATVRLYDDECARLGYETDGETLASEINTAIDAAMLAASKGGAE